MDLEDDNYKNFLLLKEYYDENCKCLVFVGEQKLNSNNKAKMYVLNANEIIEKNNFKKLFQEYLPLYIRNYDKLCNYEFGENISLNLLNYSNDIWQSSSILSTSNVESLGIMGELFNDFYINIVKDENILLTYSTKHGFAERNVRGVDISATTWEDDNLTLIFSESKFVKDIASATISLTEDIIGKDGSSYGHVSKEYINLYSYFIADQTHSIFTQRNNNNIKIINTLNKISKRLINFEKPIDVFNDLNVKIRFVFFAIYTDVVFDPNKRKEYFDKILFNFNQEVEKCGLNKYDIEIIFIPIKNNGVAIKEYMTKWD